MWKIQTAKNLRLPPVSSFPRFSLLLWQHWLRGKHNVAKSMWTPPLQTPSCLSLAVKLCTEAAPWRKNAPSLLRPSSTAVWKERGGCCSGALTNAAQTFQSTNISSNDWVFGITLHFTLTLLIRLKLVNLNQLSFCSLNTELRQVRIPVSDCNALNNSSVTTGTADKHTNPQRTRSIMCSWTKAGETTLSSSNPNEKTMKLQLYQTWTNTLTSEEDVQPFNWMKTNDWMKCCNEGMFYLWNRKRINESKSCGTKPMRNKAQRCRERAVTFSGSCVSGSMLQLTRGKYEGENESGVKRRGNMADGNMGRRNDTNERWKWDESLVSDENAFKQVIRIISMLPVDF